MFKVFNLLIIQVRSRIMVDRATFRRLNPNHTLPTPVPPKMAGDSDAATSDPRFRTPNGFDEFGNPLPYPPPIPQITGMYPVIYVLYYHSYSP